MAVYINNLLFNYREPKLNICVSLSFSNIRGVEKKKLKTPSYTLKESNDITFIEISKVVFEIGTFKHTNSSGL